MIKNITKLFIGLVFIFEILNVSAQSQWDRINNIADKSIKQEILENVDETILPQLKKTMLKTKAELSSKSNKIAELNLVAQKANSQIQANNKLIEKFKGLIRNERIADIKAGRTTNAGAIVTHQSNIDRLIKNNESQKKILKQRKTYKSALQKTQQRLKGEVSQLKRTSGYIKKGSIGLEYDEAVVAGASVMGEFAEWTEGNSSFKNVVLRAIKDGGKAAVSIGAGALAGSAAAVMSLNPFSAGGAAILSSVSAEEFYESTIGKSFERLMDREHDAINKYAVDPIKLEKMRFARKVKLYEEIKKISKDIISKQDDYNDELRKYIEERRKLWAEYEDKIKKDEEEQRKLEEGETPLVAQKPSKNKIKPGESVTVTVETTGALLPIRYSGALSYLIENNSDRYLIAYKWTADKSYEPGVYEFSVNATSASGKVGRNTVAIEVIDPNPAPAPIAKPTENYKTDTDGERLYSASELNIKEIPGAEIRKMIYKVNGIYYGYCETPSDTKTQKFDIQLGVDNRDIEGKLGLVLVKNFAGQTTIPMSDEQKEAVLVKLRERGYLPSLPYPDYLDDFYIHYFHLWGLDCKFDPVSGRIWGEVQGEYSTMHTYARKVDFTGSIEARLNNGIITGTISFPTKNRNYSFPFTAKQ